MSNEIRPPIDVSGAGTKSKPGPLDPDEIRRPPVNVQPIGTNRGSSGGGSSWMPAIVAMVVSIIAAAAMVFMFNPTKVGVDTLSGQIIQLDQRMTAVEVSTDKISGIDTSLNQLLSTSTQYVTESALSGITDGMATEASVSDLQTLVDALGIENDDLTARIAELEAVEEEQESSASTEDVRWEFRSPKLIGYTPGDVGTIYSTMSPVLEVERFRIDDEGSYEFSVQFRNPDDSSPTKLLTKPDNAVNLELILVADRGEALLNDISTYIYTDDMPSEWYEVSWIDWNDGDFTTITKGSVDITRRVNFETENFSIPSIPAGESVELDLVLELYYE